MHKAWIYLKTNPNLNEVIRYSPCVYETQEDAQKIAQKVANKEGCVCQVRDDGETPN